MKNIKLSSNISSGYTLVSNIFIDKYMPKADGSFVKVFIYLLRCMESDNTDICISDIADVMETSERDILRAISYWEREHLISIVKDENNEIISIDLNMPGHYEQPVIQEATAPISGTVSNVIPMPVIPPVIEETPSTVTTLEALLDDTQFCEMKIIIEKFLERPVSSTLDSLIINLYSKYHFAPDLILHLFEYCISKGKSNDNYIEKVGMDWAECGIDTIEKAKAYSIGYSDVYYSVMKIFGISGRDLGTDEKNYLFKWFSEYNMTKEFIDQACSRTMNAIGKPSFQYADSILANWNKHNIKSQDDIDKLDKEHDTKKTDIPKASQKRESRKLQNFNFEQRNYSDEDYASIEKRAVSKYLK